MQRCRPLHGSRGSAILSYPMPSRPKRKSWLRMLRGNSMHDLVVRNGTVVDGTGAARRQVDVAIDEGLITALEPKAGRARRDVNAEGLLVTPGWVDIHTHYDGQAT